MREALLGLTLGWAAGISPGPMLGLVISSTLRNGLGAGLRMSMVPLLSDLPIVVVSTAFAGIVSGTLLEWMAGVGGLYLIWLGLAEMRSARDAVLDGSGQVPIAKGVAVNMLSPHPWLFWLTVGGPILVMAWRRLPAAGVAFVVLFYVMIVGTKMAVAWIVSQAGKRLTSTSYRRLIIASGGLMASLGALLIFEALVTAS